MFALEVAFKQVSTGKQNVQIWETVVMRENSQEKNAWLVDLI